MQSLQPWVAAVVAGSHPGGAAAPVKPSASAVPAVVAGYADLQADDGIDHFFVHPAYAGRGVARALMAQLQADAAQRGIGRLWANVSLTAEPFFEQAGFAVEQRQRVQHGDVVLRNALMAKQLA